MFVLRASVGHNAYRGMDGITISSETNVPFWSYRELVYIYMHVVRFHSSKLIAKNGKPWISLGFRMIMWIDKALLRVAYLYYAGNKRPDNPQPPLTYQLKRVQFLISCKYGVVSQSVCPSIEHIKLVGGRNGNDRHILWYHGNQEITATTSLVTVIPILLAMIMCRHGETFNGSLRAADEV